jgi:MOSC domain-containing protein YiiM
MSNANDPGHLVSIHVAAQHGAPTHPVEEVEVVAGQGLHGDRQRKANVTLIEEEAISAVHRDYHVELEAGETRRNLVTRGVPLNHLVHKRFRVGGVVLEGAQLCEPCGHLEKLTRPGVLAALIHRGGLRARIVSGGTVRVGDPIIVESEAGA